MSIFEAAYSAIHASMTVLKRHEVQETIGAADKALGLLSAVQKLLPNNTEAQQKALAAQQELLNLREAIIQAKEDHSRLLNSFEELGKDFQNLLDFQEQQVHFRMHRYGNGTLVYCLTDPLDGIPEGTIFCVHCADQGRKGLLQFNGYETSDSRFTCTRCQRDALIPRQAGPILVSNDGGRFDGFV